MTPAEVRGWNAGIRTMIAIADAAALRIKPSPHHDFAAAVLIQLAHDARHLLKGEPDEPMAALPPRDPPPVKPDMAALEMTS